MGLLGKEMKTKRKNEIKREIDDAQDKQKRVK